MLKLTEILHWEKREGMQYSLGSKARGDGARDGFLVLRVFFFLYRALALFALIVEVLFDVELRFLFSDFMVFMKFDLYMIVGSGFIDPFLENYSM